MTNALFTCRTCNDIFRNRSELNYHVKRRHQTLIKVKFDNGHVMKVKKREDGTFKCKYGKNFKTPTSIRKHTNGCKNELTQREQNERETESMDGNDSDASERMDVDSRVIPVDCFGALISYEKC